MNIIYDALFMTSSTEINISSTTKLFNVHNDTTKKQFSAENQKMLFIHKILNQLSDHSIVQTQ